MSPDPVVVPRLGYETHVWTARDDLGASRAKLRAASGEYQSAIPATIANLDLAVPADLAADAEEATAALSRFDLYARSTLGATSPALGPMSSVLLRTESDSSSRIENLTVSARQLALAELDQSGSANARLVVGNVRAMEAALRLSDHLDVEAILAMQRELLRGQRGWEEHAGALRTTLVWVGSSGLSPRGASFVAPQAALVPEALRDLVSFIARDDLPVLVQAAITHAQFETIHPFVDGNGRTGRALVHALLRAKGVLTTTTAPVSAGLLRDTAGYVRALTAYRSGDARPVIERFAEASRFASRSGAALVDDLAAQLDHARGLLVAARVRSHAGAYAVLPHLVAHPVVNAATLKGLLGMADNTAQRALAQLVSAGVLTERTGARRNRIWQHRGILDVLDLYAQSLRRE